MNPFLQTPWAWGLLSLLPLLVVFYLLKLKRKRVVMSSTLLWRRSVEDMIANSPFQKLRNNLLLWLQLLFLLFLILGFMRPVMNLEDLGGSTVIFLIDNSASMQMNEDGLTRLSLAKQEALTSVENMGSKDEAIVIAFSDRTNVIQTLSSDKATLRNAIESIEPRDVDTSLEEAGLILQNLTSFENAEGVRVPRTNTKTMILSDGRIESLDSLVEVPNVQYIKIGESRNNLGFTAVDVRESFGDGFENQVFASVGNASDEDQTVFVELQANGEILDLRSTTVPAGGVASVVFTTAEQIDGMATLTIDGEDDLDRDNIAYASLAPPTNTKVLIVSKGNDFLESVFSADPRLDLFRANPTDEIFADQYDIIVYDNETTADLPPGNYVFLNSFPPIAGFNQADGGDVQNPEVIDWNRVHPLTRFCNFDDVIIGNALRVDVPVSAVPLVESIETDLIVLHETESRRMIMVTFDIFNSYWPLDVSFPIFWANVIEYYSRLGSGTYRPSYATGETISIFPPKEAASAKVTTPSNEVLEFSFEGISTAYLTETHEKGIYQVQFDNGDQMELAVNLLSEEETLSAPAEDIQVGGETLIGSPEVTRSNREVWHWLILAALAVMLGEWYIYCRRTFM